MPKVKITKRYLDNISVGATDTFYRDTELLGFGVKVSPKGTISFIAEGRIKRGKTKRVTLGKHPLLPLVDARKKAQEALLVMKDGYDPMELEEDERQKRAKDAAIKNSKQITLRTVFDEYRAYRSLKPKTKSDYSNTFNVCLTDWLDQPVPQITRRQVEQRFLKIRDNQGKAQAAKCMRILAAVLNYAKAYEVNDGVRLIVNNPCDVLKEKKIDRTIPERTRYLDKDELRLVVEELSHVQHPSYAKQPVRITNATVADFLMLLIFTGLRRAEASTLKWEDVDLVERYFTVHDTKNGTDHIVPMSNQVETMLQRRHDDKDKDATWVFPNKRRTGPLREPRKQIERLEEITNVKFSCHDLRRTFATLAEAHGIDHHSIKRALNHKTQDITERYIQGRAEKMRHTFEAIAEGIVWWVYEEPPLSKMTAEEVEAMEEAMKPDETYDPEFDGALPFLEIDKSKR